MPHCTYFALLMTFLMIVILAALNRVLIWSIELVWGYFCIPLLLTDDLVLVWGSSNLTLLPYYYLLHRFCRQHV